jgi:hypothetical protein
MAYRRVRSYGNTMGATSGTETANSSRALTSPGRQHNNADALSRTPYKVCSRHHERNTEEKSGPECATKKGPSFA